jgi:hypothetical protein
MSPHECLMIESVEGDRVALLGAMRVRNRIVGLIGLDSEGDSEVSHCAETFQFIPSKASHPMCWPLSRVREFERSLQGPPWLTPRLRSKWS